MDKFMVEDIVKIPISESTKWIVEEYDPINGVCKVRCVEDPSGVLLNNRYYYRETQLTLVYRQEEEDHDLYI